MNIIGNPLTVTTTCYLADEDNNPKLNFVLANKNIAYLFGVISNGTGSPLFSIVCYNKLGYYVKTNVIAGGVILHAIDSNQVTRQFSVSTKRNIWTTSTFISDWENGFMSGQINKDPRVMLAHNVTGKSPNTSTKFKIGSDAAGAYFPINGQIGELIFVTERLSDKQIDQVQNYLLDKWEIIQ